MTKNILFVILALALVPLRAAHAGPYGDFGIDFTDTLERDVMYRHIRSSPNRHTGSAASSTQVPRRNGRMPATMAATAPTAQRAALERQYATLLSTYETLVPKLHLPDRDLAGAFALLVCGAYSAYHGVEVSDTALAATSKQMRDVLAGNRAFLKLTTENKQDMYEQVAIVSTMIVVGVEGAKADPSKRDGMRELGKRYLASFADPDRLLITDKGITMAPAASASP
jgi:hypothetical protein